VGIQRAVNEEKVRFLVPCRLTMKWRCSTYLSQTLAEDNPTEGILESTRTEGILAFIPVDGILRLILVSVSWCTLRINKQLSAKHPGVYKKFPLTVLTVLSMKIALVCDVTPCRLEDSTVLKNNILLPSSQ
jgi:hypothetical protein